MRVAYVCGPYRADTIRAVVENIRSAERVALWLWRAGYAVVCPHMNTALFDGAADDSVWLAGGLEILRRCDLVVLAPGWRKSEGSLSEIAEARRHGLDVLEWSATGLLSVSELDGEPAP